METEKEKEIQDLKLRILAYKERGSKSSHDFLELLKGLRKYPLKDRRGAAYNAFETNVEKGLCSSLEIFEAAYKDPAGSEYWQGWFPISGLMTVFDFANLLSIHVTAEYIDAQPVSARADAAKIRRDNENRIVLCLKEAARAKDKDLLFEGSKHALLSFNDAVPIFFHTVNSRPDSLISSHPVTLWDVSLYPRKTLEWFAAWSERAALLPESLRSWWATKSTRDALYGPASAKKDEVPAETPLRLMEIREADERKYSNLDLYELARLVASFLIPYTFVRAAYLFFGTEQNRPYNLLFEVPSVPEDKAEFHSRFMADIQSPPEQNLDLQRVYRDRDRVSPDEWMWYDVESVKEIEGEGSQYLLLSGDVPVCLCSHDALEDVKSPKGPEHEGNYSIGNGKGKWITGQGLIDRWQVQDFELLGYLKKGLQAYTRQGKRMVDKDSLERRPKYSSIDEAKLAILVEEHRIRSIYDDQTAPIRENHSSGRHRPLSDQEVEIEAKELCNEKTTIYPSDTIVLDFSLPLNAEHAQKMIDEAKEYLFKLSGVEAFEKEHDLLPFQSTKPSTRPIEGQTAARANMKLVYAKEVMEKWKMTDLNFVDFVARHLPRILYEDLDGMPISCKGFLRPYLKGKREWIGSDSFPPEKIITHIDDLYFRMDDVEQIEKVCPELLKTLKETPYVSPGDSTCYSPDFRSVKKGEETFTLTTKQAQIIEFLHGQTGHYMSQEHILDTIGSASTSLRDLFRRNLKAWAALIEPNPERKGLFRLKP